MKKNLKIFNVCIAMIIFMMICNCYNIHAEERDNQDTTYSANGVVQNGISIVQVENDETVDKINSSDENICVYNTIIEAGQYIRDSMELRVEEVCFKYRSSSEETDKLVADIMREALKYTGKSKDGDYLMFQYSGYTYTMTGIQENDDFLYTIELHINYYTTKQQEDELDKKIDAVLTELALDGKTQYEKIYEIYSYICRNVSYDYNNLENDDYILKYTAYAAMINGTAVCQGYSNLFYRMALEAGLQARIVAGKANNEPHSWNIVEVDEMFYFLDTTWDSEKNSYSYFLKGKQSFDDHKAEFFNGNDCINGELDSEYRISDIDYCIANTWYIHRADSFSGGDGSEKPPYLITLPSQLALIENYKDCYFSLMNNIDLKEYKWYPIEEFCGTFEGNGFTISNANIEVERNKRMGIFALLNNAVIRNVEFENIKIKSTINDTSIYTNSIGSVCGIMNGGTISNCTVLCDIVVNSNPGGIDVGGFAGSITGIGALEKCYVSGNIDIYCVGGTQCGGFAGEINGEEVSMNMVSYIGNIVALSDGSMNDSSDEDVSWAENYGGLFGGQYGGKLYLNNAYDISNIAVDSLTKTLPVVGGVLGKVNIPSEGDELYANKVYCESKLTVSGTEYFQMYESASGRNEDINQSIGGDKSHIVLKNSGYFEHDIFYKQIDVDDYGQIYLKYERVNDVSLADVFVSDREFGTDTWNIKDGYFPTFINQDELEMQNIIKHNFVNGKCSVCSKVDYDFDIKGTIEDGIEWEISKGVLTLSGNGNIPNYEKLENSTLPPWKNYGFDNLIIKEGITGIGSNAFSNCESLTKVELSNSVISLGWGAFSDCINLQTINLPYGLDTLSPYLFSNCYQLKQIVMPDTVTDIGEGTFSFCLLLDNIVFSCNISSIGNRAFNHTMWLNCNKNDFVTINGILVLYQGDQENIIIPQNVNKISGSVFYNNEKILSVEIPDSVNEIGNSAFMNCSNLQSLKIPNGVTYIPTDMCCQCDNLQYVELPDSIKTIGYGAFFRCYKLNTIKLKYGIKRIDKYAFLYCKELGDIFLPEDIEDIDDLAFDGCESLKIHGFENSYSQKYAEDHGIPFISTQHRNTENVLAESSCSNTGLVEYICEDCGKRSYVIIDKKDHTKIEDNKVSPTCTKPGLTEGSHCSVCNEVLQAQEEIPALGHTWDDGEVITAPTCTEAGVKTFTCEACGDTRTEEIKATGHTVVVDNAVEPTCTKPGLTEGSHCSVCNEVLQAQEEIPALGHTWNDGEITTAPTCTESGVKTFTCETCGVIRTEEVKATGHTVVDDDAVAPTCTKTGLTAGSHCSVCNEVLKAREEIPALGHTWNDGEVTTAPTCTESGIKTFTCETCGETRTEEIKATGHTVVDDEVVEPTCTKTGLTAGSHCSVCNETIKVQEEIPVLGHTWNDGEITTAPTCTEAGVKTFTCEICGDTRTEGIKATGHTAVDDEAVAPTCTKPGLTAGSHCSVCNEVLQAQEEIPALGHTWNAGEVTTAPTCTKTGVKTFTCETCGDTRTEEIKATGHTVVVDNAVEPTCTKTGLTEGSHCSVCNEILTAQEEIPALGHTWDDGEVTTAPTCTESGIKTFTCETCGETRTEEIKAIGHTAVDDEAVAPTCTKTGLTAGSHCSVCNEVLQAQEEVPAIGHTWNDGEVTTAPTCTEAGVKTFTCKTCGETRTEEIKATGHTAVDDEAVAPTCTKTGLTAGSHCSVCNEVLKAQEEIPALGHTWNDGEVTTAPTCTETGVKTFTCETCGDTRTEKIKATGHTAVDEEAVAPTCTKPGLTAGSHCSVCNEVLQVQEEIPALGHTWNAGEVTTAPTYTTVGVKTFTCEICGETRTESIPKLSRIDISKATSKVKVSGISAKIYNGKSQTQSALVVTVAGKKLKKDTDYKVTYKNNKKIGTATLTITGKNGYTGTVRKTFAIKTQVGKVYTTSLKYKVTNARVDGKGTVSVVGSAYKSGDRKFTTLKIADTVTIGGVKFKITKIEKNSFRGYKYLSTVTIGSNVTSIGDTAFYGCGKLTAVTVGKSVKTIGAKSFAGCNNLKRVKLLTTQLTKAGKSAFNGIKANATFALPKKYYNSYSKMIKKAGAPKKAVYKKF